MRIVVHGNSVALRVRPPRERAADGTYSEVLRAVGYEVTTVARAGAMLAESFATLEDDVVVRAPEVVVLQHGVVEICPRRTIRALNNRTIENYYLNGVLGAPYRSGGGLDAVVHLGARIANGLVRRAATLLGLRWAWMPLPRFLAVMERTIAVLRKETGARVIVLGINPTSARVEGQLPGTGAATAAANAGLAALCARLGDAVRFVDPAQVLGADASALVPDGIHFSADGHRRIAAHLAGLLDDAPPPDRARGS